MLSERLELSSVSVTSARPIARRDEEPLKITSAISPPRMLLALCSPRIHLTASTTLLFPEPFGPTIAVMPGGNVNHVRSAKLLNPTSSSLLSIRRPHQGWVRRVPGYLGLSVDVNKAGLSASSNSFRRSDSLVSQLSVVAALFKR